MYRREIEFGVSNLPQKKIAYAHFTAGTYHQVGFGMLAVLRWSFMVVSFILSV